MCKTKIDVALVNDLNQILWQDSVANQSDILAQYLLTIAGTYQGRTCNRYHRGYWTVSLSIARGCTVS
jgi:hypothetical protein